MEDVIKTNYILLIDDDEDDCLFLSHALAEVSCALRLRCIQNADHLFEVIRINKPSLIFLDLHLPKNNGLDVLKRIKNHPDYSSIPIVMWSTCNFYNDVVAAYEEGAQSYFVKPIHIKELVAEIKQVLLQIKIGVTHL